LFLNPEKKLMKKKSEASYAAALSVQAQSISKHMQAVASESVR
jgi:hypothetical protein